MSFIILRKGRRWRQPFTTRMVDVFNMIARQHGSRAVWVPAMEMVVTDDPDELSKSFKYEEFITAAAERILHKQDSYRSSSESSL